MIASICEVELKLAMVDLDSSLNIMPLSTLDAVGIPQDRIFKQRSRCQDLEVTHLLLLVSLTSS